MRVASPNTSTEHLVFTREEFLQAPYTLIRQGRRFNARVFTVKIHNQTWLIKDFANKPWYTHSIALALVAHEKKFLQTLAGRPGFTQAVFSPDALSLAVAWIPGESLWQIHRERITETYLLKLEALIKQLHASGIVHLDLRNAGNILCTPKNTPALIDFQSAVFTRHLPQWLRRELEALDMSGAYKMWLRFAPDAMDDTRREALDRANRLRRWWPFTGYFGIRKKADSK